MTLEKTWEECLRMWKWIVGEGVSILDEVVGGRVYELKRVWLSINEYGYIYNYCFFCDYAEKHSGSDDCRYCTNCPARKIDKHFYCQDPGTHWCNNPVEFYERLVKLNKKRLSKKRKDDVCN